jgi:hypothetical protein
MHKQKAMGGSAQVMAGGASPITLEEESKQHGLLFLHMIVFELEFWNVFSR